MNPRSMYLAGAAVAVSLVAGAAVLHEGDSQEAATATSLAGVAAGMHFTDEMGNARLPTAEERAALAEAFQADIANLTKGKRIPKGEQRLRDGGYTAVVGTEEMKFLTVEVDENGNTSFGHSTMDESGRVVVEHEHAPAQDWPEM